MTVEITPEASGPLAELHITHPTGRIWDTWLGGGSTKVTVTTEQVRQLVAADHEYLCPEAGERCDHCGCVIAECTHGCR